MSAARQMSLLDAVWLPVKDANDVGRALFENHYSRRHRRSGKQPLQFVGPGERMVLITPDALAVFAWRHKPRAHRDNQTGVMCSIFRNEGTTKSSDLIRAAVTLAWERWPGERLFTYVDTRKIRHKRDPGRCFLRAGWRLCGETKKQKLLILEIRPEVVA